MDHKRVASMDLMEDRLMSWERLLEQRSHPLETAEYTEANLLLQEPAFS